MKKNEKVCSICGRKLSENEGTSFCDKLLCKECFNQVTDIFADSGERIWSDNNFGSNEIAMLEKGGQVEVRIEGETISLVLEDVEITSEDIPGWSVATENNVTVALDIAITDELKKEGIARDLVNRIQNMRKDMGLEVQDKIVILLEKNEDMINSAIESNKTYICGETQALEIKLLETLADGKELDMDEFSIKVKIEKQIDSKSV